MDQMWKARKAEVLKAGRLRHGSTDTTLSQLSSVQLTMDEGFSSQEADEEDDSDNEDRSSGDGKLISIWICPETLITLNR